MKMIIDRFEGDLAIIELENGEFVDLPKKILPNNANEGSVVNIVCDDEETQQLKVNAKKKIKSIFHN